MRRIAWLYIGAVALACSLAIIAFGVIPKLWPYPGDFTVFWSAARSATPYDWSLLKEAEIATVGGPVGPFAYPPTALLLLKPFGLLPFFPALFLWVGLGLSAFVFAGRTPLALLSAPVVIAAATGQTSLIVGALLIGAFTVKGVTRGILIGLAVAIKPQFVFLFPVAFIASGDWRALYAALLAGALAVASTLVIWGIQPWFGWIAAIWVLTAEAAGLANIAPASFGVPLPLCIAAGALLVWTVFRQGEGSAAALSCGCLLSLPYAMSYDLVVLAVATVPMLLNREGNLLSWSGAAMVFSTVLAPLGLVLMALSLLRPSWTLPLNYPVLGVARQTANRANDVES